MGGLRLRFRLVVRRDEQPGHIGAVVVGHAGQIDRSVPGRHQQLAGHAAGRLEGARGGQRNYIAGTTNYESYHLEGARGSAA